MDRRFWVVKRKRSEAITVEVINHPVTVWNFWRRNGSSVPFRSIFASIVGNMCMMRFTSLSLKVATPQCVVFDAFRPLDCRRISKVHDRCSCSIFVCVREVKDRYHDIVFLWMIDHSTGFVQTRQTGYVCTVISVGPSCGTYGSYGSS